MTKKKKTVVRNFGGWKSENFLEKVKLKKFSAESEKFLGNRGESETEGENASLPQGGWTPLPFTFCYVSRAKATNLNLMSWPRFVNLKPFDTVYPTWQLWNIVFQISLQDFSLLCHDLQISTHHNDSLGDTE